MNHFHARWCGSSNQLTASTTAKNAANSIVGNSTGGGGSALALLDLFGQKEDVEKVSLHLAAEEHRKETCEYLISGV